MPADKWPNWNAWSEQESEGLQQLLICAKFLTILRKFETSNQISMLMESVDWTVTFFVRHLFSSLSIEDPVKCVVQHFGGLFHVALIQLILTQIQEAIPVQIPIISWKRCMAKQPSLLKEDTKATNLPFGDN